MIGRHALDAGLARSRSQAGSRDRGDTLIEVLVAVLIIAISVAALLDGLITSTTASATHRSLATIDGLLKSYAETAKYVIQDQANPTFNDCANTTTNPYTVQSQATVPAGYSVGISSIQYWDGSGFSAAANCSADEGVQLITLLAAAPNHVTATMSFVVTGGSIQVTPVNPTLILLGAAPGTAGTPLGAGAVTVTLINGAAATGNITFSYLITQSPTPPSSCTTGGTVVGTVPVAGNATYGMANFTPDVSGNYWWFAAYSGDTYNKAATSTCGSAISETPVSPGLATQLVFTSAAVSGPASSTANLGPITLEEEDQFGNATTQAETVALSSNTAGTAGFSTSPNGATTTTAAIPVGSSSVDLYYGDTRSGSPTIKATAGGLTPGTQQETITASTPTKIVVTSGSGQSAGVNSSFTNPLVATVTDTFGNLVPGASVTFSGPASGASETFAAAGCTSNPQPYSCVATTNVSGVATSSTFTANTTAGGPYNISASAPGTGTVNFSETNTAGAAATIVVTSGSGQSAIVAHAFTNPLVATVRDTYGNPVPGVSVTFTGPSSGSSETFAAAGCTSNPHTYSCVATTNAGGVATSSTFTANTAAGGPYNISASAPGTNTVNFSETNNVGTATTIVVTSGSGQSATVNNAFTSKLTATVTDTYGNPVPGVSVTFAGPSAGASITFAAAGCTSNPHTYSCVATTNASGVATSSTLTANTIAGTYNISASAPGTNTVNFSETNTAGAATTIAVTSGSGQSATVNNAFTNPLTATVTDTYGNPVAGVSVTFSGPASGSSESFAAAGCTSNPHAYSCVATTNASGVATSSTFTANTTTGTYNISASAPGTNTVNFSETNRAGTPTSVVVTSGSGQSATVGTAFTSPLVVTVKDTYGNLVTGASVTFAGPSSGASITFAAGGNCTSNPHTYSCVATTNASGVATSSTFTANGSVGTYVISASAGTGSANFSETNTVGAATTIVVTSGSPQHVTTGHAFANPLVATVTDIYGNPVPGVSVTFAGPASGASESFAALGCTSNPHTYSCVATTNASGVVTSSTFIANTITGTYNISANAPGTNTVNFSETNTVVTLSGYGSNHGSGSASINSLTGGTPSSGATMILLVYAQPSGAQTPTITSFSGSGYSGTPTLITTVSPGANYEIWAYSVSASGSSSNITVSLSHASYVELDVGVLAGNNTTTPIAQDITNIGTSVTANAKLTTAPTLGDGEIAWVGTDGNDAGIPSTPGGWTKINAGNSSSGSGYGFGSYFTETNTSTSQNFGLGQSAPWATIALDIAGS